MTRFPVARTLRIRPKSIAYDPREGGALLSASMGANGVSVVVDTVGDSCSLTAEVTA